MRDVKKRKSTSGREISSLEEKKKASWVVESSGGGKTELGKKKRCLLFVGKREKMLMGVR